ncbi:hypothetical protein WJX75_005075 [Coccomyxa subellipsoidea]|uniref:DUF3445 domain-containing protein n=1 Tax=Coccomyxa subellipsoidea TaxID=248742 RepID=A0ABR2YGF6_9CHLO
MQCALPTGSQAAPPRARPQCSAAVRCHLGAVPTSQPGESNANSKCPIMRLVNGTKGLLRSAAPAVEAPTRHFSHDVFEYTPFSAPNYQGKYKMTMGLEPMHPMDWIEIDEHYDEEMALRRKLMKEKRDIVLHSLPGADAANAEMLELLADFLPKRFPDRFTKDGNVLINHSTGDVWNLADPSLDPLEVSALLVQEDLCVMTADEQGVLRFVSGAVLFPQRWSLLEKIGADMRRIHDPVPIFNDQMLKPVSNFMDRLAPNKPFYRANWTISDNPELFQPLVEEDILAANAGEIINDKVWGETEPITVQNAGERLQTRCERETLSRFPKTGAILFTIRTHMHKLNTFEKKPDKAWELARALRNLPHDLVKYKTIAAFKDQALAYLDKISMAPQASKPEPFLP